MSSTPVPAPVPIEGVVFDLHHTLVDPGAPERWLELAWQHLGRPGAAAQTLEPPLLTRLFDVLARVWELADEVDPDSRRDLDPATHRLVFRRVLRQVAGVQDDLVDALYRTMLDTWIPYDDTLPVLQLLHEQARRLVVLSNVGIDVRPVLDRTGISGLIGGLVLSFEVGAVKPDRAIFARALDVLGLPAEQALMVGDSFRDDAAAAALGIRTLILPRTHDGTRGLESVVRLVG